MTFRASATGSEIINPAKNPTDWRQTVVETAKAYLDF